MSARIIGLTGQTGAGKSTVCRLLNEAGFVSIDCDLLTRSVQTAGSPCVAALAAAFGTGILLPDGALNRKGLAAIVFSDEEALKKLGEIVYPFVLRALELRINELSKGHTNGIVLDAPTLFESGADALCGDIIAVIAPKEIRLARIMARDGLTEAQAFARMSAQKDDAFYTSCAQYVIRNGTDEAQLERDVADMAAALLAKSGTSGKPN